MYWLRLVLALALACLSHSAAPAPVTNSSPASSGSSVGSSASDHGAHGVWWTADYEYLHFESYVVAVIICMAMLFDGLHHRLSHFAAHDHAVEEVTQLNVHHDSDVTLWESLFNHCTGELMVLGFIAFVVWVLNRTGFFEKVAETVKSDFALPSDGNGYLHTIEDVHMQVFIAMLIYIFILAIVAHGVSKTERVWEVANARVLTAHAMGFAPNELEYGDGLLTQLQLDNFVNARKEFLKSIEDWRGSWDLLDIELEPLLVLLGTTLHNSRKSEARTPKSARSVRSVRSKKSNASKFSMKSSSSTPMMRCWKTEKNLNITEMLDPFFPFDHYLTLQCRFLVINLMRIKASTWLFIAFVQVMKAQLLREFHDWSSASFDFFMLACFLTCVMMAGYQVRRARARHGAEFKKNPRRKTVVEHSIKIRNSVHDLFLQAGYNLQQHDEAARSSSGNMARQQSIRTNGSQSLGLTRMRKNVKTMMHLPFIITRKKTPTTIETEVDDYEDDEDIQKISQGWAVQSTGSCSAGIHVLRKPRDRNKSGGTSSHCSHQLAPSVKLLVAPELPPIAPVFHLQAPGSVEATENDDLRVTASEDSRLSKDTLDLPLQLPSKAVPKIPPMSLCFDVSIRQDVPSSSAAPPPRNTLQAPSSVPARRTSFTQIREKAQEVAREVRVHKEYPWMLALTMLQIALFSLSLSMVRFMIVAYWWEHSTWLSITSCVLVVVGGPILGYLLGKAMPALAVLIARVEFMEARNVNWVSIILEDHVTGRDLFCRARSRRHLSRCRSTSTKSSSPASRWHPGDDSESEDDDVFGQSGVGSSWEQSDSERTIGVKSHHSVASEPFVSSPHAVHDRSEDVVEGPQMLLRAISSTEAADDVQRPIVKSETVD